jgi:localization factor PodJL
MGPKPPAPTALPNRVPPLDGLPQRLRSAATNGDANAEYEIASRYFEGRGVPQNTQEAVSWFERAAARDLAPAQYRLGGLYEKGQGVKKDIDQARRLYRAAADSGNAKAMHNLAVLYAEGVEGKPDFRLAAHWFHKAARYGVADSQYNLAILYARGMGVNPNLSESYKWFALGAQQGDKEAANKRDEIAARLDKAALAAARLDVQNFTPEKQPDAAVNVPAPAGGWDAPQPATKPRTGAAPSRKSGT